MALLAVLWLFSIKKKTPYFLLLLFPVCSQAAPVNFGGVAGPTFAQLSLWICKLPALSKEGQPMPSFPIAFDECLIRTSLTQIRAGGSCFQLTMQKPRWQKTLQTLQKVQKLLWLCFPSCLFCPVFAAFWPIFSFNCTSLSFSSPLTLWFALLFHLTLKQDAARCCCPVHFHTL